MSSLLKRQDEVQSSSSPAKKRRKSSAKLSCAECRRLKLKCDRQIPCSSCVKRGVAQVCPDGCLTTGQGNRFVLASTTELHDKIHQLSLRVRALEDGLRESHAKTSHEMHDLLTPELLKIKAPLEREVPHPAKEGQEPKHEDEEELTDMDAYGSLSITLSGRESYYGRNANSVYFLMNETARDEEHADELAERVERIQKVLPIEILSRSAALATSTTSNLLVPGDAHVDDLLLCYLPTASRATELREAFYSLAAWMYVPCTLETFNEQIFSQFYYDEDLEVPLKEDSSLSHKTAVIYMVLAIGSLMDLKLAAYNVEAEKYHQLARAALFQSPVFDEPTIYAVQAFYLMSFYLFLSDRHQTVSGARWAIMGMAVKVAQSIGLHRDSGRWKLDEVETTRRRGLFWELYTYDSWQCLTFGRPPSFSNAHIDCKMPHTGDPSPDQSFHAWKHKFTSECMTQWHDIAAKSPKYAVVLALDRKLRAFAVPAILQVPGFGNSTIGEGSSVPETTQLMLQRHIVLAIRETNLLYLHRSFFARALTDSPNDPLQSDYGTSVIAAYRSAGSLVALIRNMYAQLPEVSTRLWFLWAHMFSCSIVLGSIVVKAPSMSLAPSALVQLDSACELFAKTAAGFRAQPILDVMAKLQQKAHHSLNEFRSKISSAVLRGLNEPITPVDDENDELLKLGGQTRIITKKEPASPSPIVESPITYNPTHSPISMVPLPLQHASDHNVHPSVAEYLRSFTSPNPSMQSSTNSLGSVAAMASGYGGAGAASYGSSARSTTFASNQMPYTPTLLSSTTTRHHHPQQYPSQHSHGLPSPPLVNYSSLPPTVQQTHVEQAPIASTSYGTSQDYSMNGHDYGNDVRYMHQTRSNSMDFSIDQYQAQPSMVNPPRQRQHSNGDVDRHNHHQPARRGSSQQQHQVTAPTFGGTYAFPSYFPVFDYGNPGAQGSSMYDAHPQFDAFAGGSMNRSTGSPSSGDRTWQDFVDGLEMQ